MSDKKEIFVGIDLGGTRCRVMTSLTLDAIQKVRRQEFTLTHAFEIDMSMLITTIRQLTSEYKLVAIGLGVTGDVNPEKTAFVDPANNLEEWSGKPVRLMLEAELSCPVLMDNDGVTAALGEAYFGQGKGKDFVFVIWGTGIGGASIKFAQGQSVCTQLDWYKYFESWEQKCGGNKIEQLYGKEGSQLSDAEWGSVMADFQAELALFVQKTNAQFIIFGGGIAIKQEERLRAAALQCKGVQIGISRLGEDTGLYGALALLRLSA